MFHLVVLVMFGLMAYGLWSLLNNLAKLNLSKSNRSQASRKTSQPRQRVSAITKVSPSTDRLSPDKAKAELQRRKHLESLQMQQEQRAIDQLRRRLVMMLRGDADAADGLVESARKAKPFMGEQWYIEKVLSDLERDRFR
jgi:hypothetical protein